MILRKPYAFLIKYFKLINFLLALLSGYIAIKTYNVISFFNDFVSNNYSGSFYNGFYHEYISLFFVAAIVLVIIGAVFLGVLFLYKKKPFKLYLSSIIYSVVLLIILMYFKNLMVSLETTLIGAEVARIYRDISLISIIPQFFFILAYLVRGLGFNINKFDFEKDIKDLEIDEHDDEEIEIAFHGDSVKLQRNIRRLSREFIYYIKENKFIVLIIICVLLAISVFIGIQSMPKKVDQEYNQGESFNIDSFTYNIQDSILTKTDYNGNELDSYYLVLKLNVENNSDDEKFVDLNDFRLKNGQEFLYPSKDKGKYFIDYAIEFSGTAIKSKSNKTFSLIYRLPNNNIKKKYIIKVSSGSASNNKEIVGKYSLITVTPPIIHNDTAIEREVSKGQEISFENSNLGQTKFMIDNPIITDKYVYNYEYCPKINNCTTYKDSISIDFQKNNKVLIVIDYNYELDKNVPFASKSKEVKEFVNHFMNIKYVENNKTKYANVTDVTPKNLKNKLVLETTNSINKLSHYDLAILIRNKEYIIKIK